MTRSLLIGLLLTLTASAASAQELSASEAAWAAHVGGGLGELGAESGRFTLRVPAGVAAGPREVRGLRVAAGDLVVHRVRFSSAAAADAIAGRVELGTPMVGEVRGVEAVFIVGAPVKDPYFATRTLDLAWEGLPAPGPATATFAYLGPGDLAVVADQPRSCLWASVGSAIARARRYPDAGVWSGPDDVLISTPTGRSLHARRDAQRGTMWIAASPARAADMDGYLRVLTGRYAPRPAGAARATGLQDVIDGQAGISTGSTEGVESVSPGDVARPAERASGRGAPAPRAVFDRGLGE